MSKRSNDTDIYTHFECNAFNMRFPVQIAVLIACQDTQHYLYTRVKKKGEYSYQSV